MSGGDLRIGLGKGLQDDCLQVDVGTGELQLRQLLSKTMLDVAENVLNSLQRSDDGGTYVPLRLVGHIEDRGDVAVFHVLAHDFRFVARGVIQEDGG